MLKRRKDGSIIWIGRSGPQIHFLHANGFCAGTYTPFLRYLMADFHVFASDVRGHGGSTFSGAPRIRHWDIFRTI